MEPHFHSDFLQLLTIKNRSIVLHEMAFVSTKCHLEVHSALPFLLPSTTLSLEVAFSAFYTADPSNFPSYLRLRSTFHHFFQISNLSRVLHSRPVKLLVTLKDCEAHSTFFSSCFLTKVHLHFGNKLEFIYDTSFAQSLFLFSSFQLCADTY